MNTKIFILGVLIICLMSLTVLGYTDRSFNTDFNWTNYTSSGKSMGIAHLTATAHAIDYESVYDTMNLTIYGSMTKCSGIDGAWAELGNNFLSYYDANTFIGTAGSRTLRDYANITAVNSSTYTFFIKGVFINSSDLKPSAFRFDGWSLDGNNFGGGYYYFLSNDSYNYGCTPTTTTTTTTIPIPPTIIFCGNTPLDLNSSQSMEINTMTRNGSSNLSYIKFVATKSYMGNMVIGSSNNFTKSGYNYDSTFYADLSLLSGIYEGYCWVNDTNGLISMMNASDFYVNGIYKQCWGGTGFESDSETFYLINIAYDNTNVSKYLSNTKIEFWYCPSVPLSYGNDPFDTGLNEGGNMLNYFRSESGNCELVMNQTTASNGRTDFRIKRDYYCNMLRNGEVIITANHQGYNQLERYESLCLLQDNSVYNNASNTTAYLLTYGLNPTSGFIQNTLNFHVFELYNMSKNIEGALVSVSTNSGTQNCNTDSDGECSININGLEYAYTVSKNGYYSRSIPIAYYDGNTIEVALASTSGVKYSLTGWVLDNSSGSVKGIANCPMKAECQYKLSSGDVNREKVIYTTITQSNLTPDYSDGYYNFSGLDGGATCIVSTSCLGYNNDYFSYVVDNDYMYNFLLGKETPKVMIYGYIKDYDSNEGINDADISITHGDKIFSFTGFSDDTGYYSFNDVPVGNISITVSKSGYSSKQEEIQIFSDTKRDYYLLSSSSQKWIRGKCLSVNENNNESLVNCRITIKDSMHDSIVSTLTASSGLFSYKTASNVMYKITAEYNGESITQNVALTKDMNYNDLEFRFYSVNQDFLQNLKEGISVFLAMLGSIIVLIGVLSALIILKFFTSLLQKL